MKNRLAWIVGILLVCLGARAAEKDIRVLTYNVGLLRALGSDIVKNVDQRAAKLPARLADLANARDIDVLFLQEVWEKGHAEAFATALGDSFVTRWPKDQVPFGGTSGLFLAVRKSRFEIGEKDGGLKPFGSKEKAGLEKMAAKGILVAQLRSPNSDLPPVALIGTHLQCLAVDPQTGTATDPTEVAAHAAQTARLARQAQEFAAAGLPALILGDFNVGPVLGKAQFESLSKTFAGQNAFYQLSPDSKATSWDQKNPLILSGRFPDDPSDLVDHVFYQGAKGASLTPTRAEIVLQEADGDLNSPLSDHYGVLVELRLKN